MNFSCTEKCKYDVTDNAVKEYIDYFKSLKKIKKRDFMVKIHIDSSYSKYDAYRISTSAQLLSKKELPNRIDTYKGMKIAYFTENILDEHSKEKQTLILKEKAFYYSEYVNFLSNYPEWILMKKKSDKCFKLVKNANYRDLIEIIENVEKDN